VTASTTRILKQGPRRSVRLEQAADGAATVVKRIETAGWHGLRARRLARREHALQARLAAGGLSVPRALELCELEGAVELRQDWIPGARTLAEVLREAPGQQGALGALAALALRAGRLLAGAHARGLDHPDLHEGNLLVDAQGAPWLIDFHGARLRARLDAAVVQRDLVQLAAATRERVPVRLLQRALIAWWRAVPPELHAEGSLAQAAAEFERAARGRRRAVLARATKRWQRPSSSARAFALGAGSGGARGMARAELDDQALERLLGQAAEAASFEVGRQVAGFAGGARVLVLAELEPRRIEAAFLSAARLADHGLRAARPLLCERSRALFALPPGTQLAVRARPAPERLAPALGTLAGALEDRGLELADPSVEALALDPAGRAWLLPDRKLRERPLDHSGTPWRAWLALLPDAREWRRAFAAAWLAEQRVGSAPRRELARRLEDG